MKNKEKYDLRECPFSINNGTIMITTPDGNISKYFEGYKEFVKWLESEYKKPVELTNIEKIILENVFEGCGYIARDKNGNLNLFDGIPTKQKKEGFWIAYGWEFGVYNHLFQFVKWEDDEPYNIQELLENYEVKND